MAKIEQGSFTPSGTGNTTVLFADNTLLADRIDIWVAPTGASDGVNHASIGVMTPTQQRCISTMTETTGSTTRNASAKYNTKCISHRNVVSSTVTEVLAASYNDMTTAGEFTINFSINPGTFQVYFIATEY